MQFYVLDHLLVWYLFPGYRGLVHPLMSTYGFHGAVLEMEMEGWLALLIGFVIDAGIFTTIWRQAISYFKRRYLPAKDMLDNPY